MDPRTELMQYIDNRLQGLPPPARGRMLSWIDAHIRPNLPEAIRPSDYGIISHTWITQAARALHIQLPTLVGKDFSK
jgi:hypothetical protein